MKHSVVFYEVDHESGEARGRQLSGLDVHPVSDAPWRFAAKMFAMMPDAERITVESDGGALVHYTRGSLPEGLRA